VILERMKDGFLLKSQKTFLEEFNEVISSDAMITAFSPMRERETKFLSLHIFSIAFYYSKEEQQKYEKIDECQKQVHERSF
jgi:hypothetical protein